MYQDAPAAEFVYVLNDAGDRLRGGRGPGAGRQGARGEAAGAHACPRLLRRCARPSQLRERPEPRFTARSGARIRSRASGLLRREKSRRASPDDVSIMLYTSGTTGQAQGRLPDAPRLHRLGEGRLRVRPARARRQHPLVPADGLGRRPPVLLRAVAGRRLHDQLSGVGRHGDDRPARDRPDLLLRAAAHLREPAHPGHDPHGGRERAQALAVPSLHGGRPALSARIFSTARASASSIGCSTRSAISSSTGRCATCSA